MWCYYLVYARVMTDVICMIYVGVCRAEECFRRAAQAEKPDAEALSLYADFLWYVRNDIWGAEERYLQAISAEPSSPYYASRYARFLWRTGGTDTCYPLESYDKVS